MICHKILCRDGNLVLLHHSPPLHCSASSSSLSNLPLFKYKTMLDIKYWVNYVDSYLQLNKFNSIPKCETEFIIFFIAASTLLMCICFFQLPNPDPKLPTFLSFTPDFVFYFTSTFFNFLHSCLLLFFFSDLVFQVLVKLKFI